jgi:SAM-dependent methyltransferase
MNRFDFASHTYDNHAYIQRTIGCDLAHFIQNTYGRICDVGCGTGYMGTLLPVVDFVDISPRMIEITQQKFKNARCISADAQSDQWTHDLYDVMVSNLLVQWFDDFESGIQNLLTQTKRLVFSTLIKGTFDSWHRLCDRYELPKKEFLSFDNINAILPHARTMHSSYRVSYPSPRHVLDMLRGIGAQGHFASQGHLRALLQNTDPIDIEYEVLFVDYSRE